MRSLSHVSLVLFSGFGALACTNSAEPQTPALADDLAQAFCAHQFACCSPIEIAGLAGGRYLTETECLPYARLAANSELALLDSAIATGHITVDQAAAEACLAAYAARACNTSLVAPEPVLPVPDAAAAFASCANLLVGHVPAGSACTLSEECVPGSRCTGGASVFSGGGGLSGVGGFGGGIGQATTGGIGACVAYQGVGQLCNQSADCDQSARLYCHQPDFTCAAPAGPGSPCGYDFFGNPIGVCDTAMGLHCDPRSATCRRYPGKDEPCDFTSGVSCDPDPAQALSCNFFTQLCVAPGLVGDPCGGSALAPCRWDLECVPTQPDGIGACQTAPSLGEPCRSKCQTPAVCDGAVCRQPGSLPVGASCSTAEDCATLNCSSTFSASPACFPAPSMTTCAGSTVTTTFGTVNTGMGGSAGIAGSVGSGFAGSFGSGSGGFGGGATLGIAGSVGTMTGSGGPTDGGSSDGGPSVGGKSGGGPGGMTGAGAATGGGGMTGAGAETGGGGMTGAGGITGAGASTGAGGITGADGG